MNTPSNAMPDAFDPQGISPTPVSATRPFYWCLRRELWEHRSLFIAPLAVSGFVLLGFLIGLLAHRMSALVPPDITDKPGELVQPYEFAAGLFMFTQMLLGLFYCLDALHGERRDRSILFWKSLPVSDLTTVLSKATIVIVVLPLITFAFTVATQFAMLLLNSGVRLASGQSVAVLWTQVPLFQMCVPLFYHLLAVHGFWYAPFFGWLLLVSAWARRAPFLWATVPLLAIGLVERIAFHTLHFCSLLGNRLSTSGQDAMAPPGRMPIDPMTHLTPLRFLSSPGLWFGLLFMAVCLLLAARLRHYREPV